MKKKILFINGHLNVGGVEKSLVDILQHMDYDKFDVDLLLLEGLGDYAKEIPEQVNVFLLSLENTYGKLDKCLVRCIRQKDWFSLRMRLIFLAMKLFGQKQIKLAKKLLTDNKHYDCVIGFRSGICTQIAAFAVKADKKVTWWHHGEFNVDAKEYSVVAEACDIVVSVSESCAEMILENVPSIRSRLIVIPNMVDALSLEKKSEAIVPYAKEKLNLVTVCRIVPEKHIENVVYASKQLKIKGYKFQWHIVGDGILRKQMEDLALQEALQDVLIFEGSKLNPYPYIKHAALYVHPSYVESQGLTVVEAMTLGVPCVVTKARGPMEFIVHGENGVLVDKKKESLVQGIEEILNDKELYKKIICNSKCPDEFETCKVMRKIYEILE